jgi:hypothetical protein
MPLHRGARLTPKLGNSAWLDYLNAPTDAAILSTDPISIAMRFVTEPNPLLSFPASEYGFAPISNIPLAKPP